MRDRQDAQAASRRADAIGAVLRYDLNGDLRVTADEVLTAQKINAPTPHPARTKKASAARAEWDRLMQRYDYNLDGAIDLQEVSRAASAEDRSDRANPIAALLDSDLGRDGKLTRTEVKAFGQRTFTAIDTNKNGRISSEEYADMCAAPLSFAARVSKVKPQK
ncbi:MAG: EF-hand domain-containing protein [Pseudomonadota bacterium]